MKTGDLYGEDPDCYYIKKFFEKGFWADNQFLPEGERRTQLEMEYLQKHQSV
jgi:hypothetical protein